MVVGRLVGAQIPATTLFGDDMSDSETSGTRGLSDELKNVHPALALIIEECCDGVSDRHIIAELAFNAGAKAERERMREEAKLTTKKVIEEIYLWAQDNFFDLTELGLNEEDAIVIRKYELCQFLTKLEHSGTQSATRSKTTLQQEGNNE